MDKPLFIIGTYGFALLGALAFLYLKRRARRRRLRTVLRVLFAPKIWLAPSSIVDFGYLFAAFFVFPIFFLYTTITAASVSVAGDTFLRWAFGARTPHAPDFIFAAVMGAGIYLAYEFAYWLNHYISHRIAFLWHFHKVHHSATVLTPITVWRVHIIDSIVFANMTLFTVGLTQGVISYLFGTEMSLSALAASNILLAGFMALYGHLQHSQIWIPFRGAIGHIFFSPAHHQIHHSNNPSHFNKNFGSSLAIFDWMFGTLHMPQQKDERLSLGVDNNVYTGRFFASLLIPFRDAAKEFRLQPIRLRKRRPKLASL